MAQVRKRWEGISRAAEGVPSIRMAEPWIDGTAPTLEEMAAFMGSAGFTQIRREMFAGRVAKNLTWYRVADSVAFEAVAGGGAQGDG